MVRLNLFSVFLLFSLVSFSLCVGATGENIANSDEVPFKIVSGVLDYGINYSCNISRNVSYIFTYRAYEHESGMAPPRISIRSPNAQNSYPILISVSQRANVRSWTLPLRIRDSNYTYPDTSRTLCVEDAVNSTTQELAVVVNVGCASPTNVTFELRVDKQTNFSIEMWNKSKPEKNNINITLTPSDPVFYFFEFKKGVDSVLLTVESDDESCMTLSVQNKTCPVHDMAQTRSGFYLTITRKGGIVILRDQYPDGMYIVFHAHGTDYLCKSNPIEELYFRKTIHITRPKTDRGKNIKFKVEKSIGHSVYLYASTLMIAMFFIIYAVVGLLLVVKRRKR